MSKLYVFGIGGTGARVLRSLTMMLASGVECDMDIVPIFIDPDKAAYCLTKAVETIDKYVSVRSKLRFDNDCKNKFFRTNILNNVVDRYIIPLNDTDTKKFKDYISIDTMTHENQALIRMLFSEGNLNSGMKVGFEGNPNMGSIVLNQFKESNEFKSFASHFKEGDRIFIISSIFGGTGASGFPLLLKMLRNANKDNLNNGGILQKALIGGISVLPYFKVKQKKDSIDSSTFISKTRAALSYYHRNIISNNTIDYLYYIADNTGNNIYENNKGANDQKNEAHIIELLSALAIIDFAKIENPKIENRRTVIKEYGLAEDAKEVIFKNLGSKTQNQIKDPFIQFLLMTKYLNKYVNKGISDKLAWIINYEFEDSGFFNSDFYKDVKSMLDLYIDWLKELSAYERSFSPFELDENDKIFSIIKGCPPSKVHFWERDNYELFTSTLDKHDRKNQNNELESLFMELFYIATKKLIKERSI